MIVTGTVKVNLDKMLRQGSTEDRGSSYHDPISMTS